MDKVSFSLIVDLEAMRRGSSGFEGNQLRHERERIPVGSSEGKEGQLPLAWKWSLGSETV